MERTEILEILVNNIAVTEFPLGNQPNLRDAKKILAIEAYGATQIPIAPSGKAVVNNNVFVKSFLRLINSQNADLRYTPLVALNPVTNENPKVLTVDGSIDPEKSKIVVGTVANLVINEVFLLAVTYEK